MTKKILARQALRAAIRERRANGVPEDSPISAIDFADRPEAHLEVWLVDEPRLEGMYCAGSTPRILVSSHRTLGRQALTCAHELGHHAFGHGTRWDQYLYELDHLRSLPPDEYLADLFAHYLLMPRQAVVRSFQERGVDPAAKLDDECVFLVACNLGVSYSALVNQLHFSLGLISAETAKRLLRTTPKAIRNRILGFTTETELFLVDRHWFGRAVDIHVGDTIAVDPQIASEGTVVEAAGASLRHRFLKGVRPGVGRLLTANDDWSVHVRVSRRFDKFRTYHGRAMYRHWEDPDCDSVDDDN